MSTHSDDPLEPTEPLRSDLVAGPGEPISPANAPTQAATGPTTGPPAAGPTVSLTPGQTEPDLGDRGAETGDLGDVGDRTTAFDDRPAGDPPAGARIRYLGDFELRDILGQGGMGVVYRAWQLSLNRWVAVKLIRNEGLPGEPELRRFRHEAEAVAALDHPGIVPIYEVGTDAGRHYFSMKLISGESLQKASPKLRGQFAAIGRIIVGTARALQHAHERGILHRDIKPANLLLDAEGKPHLSDFGLAKRFDVEGCDLTRTDAIMGTPAYMAPEQATASQGAITTATDIYGLGSVLYSLLSGHAPHRGSSVLEILDAVREEVPTPPSKDDPTIPRDLEVICMKCLAKDPKGRYHSAGDLADDLDRWLSGRPIAARKVGPATRAVMWCKRKPLIAGLAAALLISFVAGAAGILLNWREVRRQRDRLARANTQIRAEWETSRQLNAFLVNDLLAWSSPRIAGRRDVPVSTLLDRSASHAGSRFANQPKIEGSIRQIIGSAYLTLGMLPKAEAELVRSARLRQNLPKEDELDRLSTEFVLGSLRIEQGRYDEAEAHVRKALDGRRQRLGDADEATLDAAAMLGAVLHLKGKVGDARAVLEKTADDARKALGDEHRVTLQAMLYLAVIAYDQGRIDEASASFDQLAQTSARVFGADHPETLFARSRLGASLIQLGKSDRAEAILAQALERARNVLGPDHPETLRINANLAFARVNLGKHEAAAKGISETLEGQSATLPVNHIDLLKAEMIRAVALLRQGKPAEAEPLLRDLIPRMRLVLKDDDPTLGDALSIHAGALWDLNQTAKAEPLNAEAAAILRKKNPPDYTRITDVEGVQAALLLANGKAIEAEELARKVIAARSKPGANTSPWRLGTIKSVLGGALAGQQKFADAEPLLVEGFQTLEADPKTPKRRLADALERVIQLYESWGKPQDAALWRARRVARPDP